MFPIFNFMILYYLNIAGYKNIYFFLVAMSKVMMPFFVV
ncbi:uncharacterized protein MP3633_1032 [Marinomonas primoryensis]|uniref:Uncharacterized protein n=1 Tax=Marinomonas primoryensis TaxID=178399 RepID=A0A859CU61_9GAMM|nr:uncharacterized protein MP3633_1032 [Marinomonas primoryensis]